MNSGAITASDWRRRNAWELTKTRKQKAVPLMLSLGISRQNLHPVARRGFKCVFTEILERMGTVIAARWEELKFPKEYRAERDWLGPIARMQPLFSPTSHDA